MMSAERLPDFWNRKGRNEEGIPEWKQVQGKVPNNIDIVHAVLDLLDRHSDFETTHTAKISPYIDS
jgi:hypothetical protein